MKKVAIIAIAFALSLCMFGCGLSQNQTEDQSDFKYPCPEGYTEISIGEIATYIPNEWKKSDKSLENVHEYLLAKYPDDRDTSIFLMRHDDEIDTSQFTRNDFEIKLTERTKKTHPEEEGTLLILDLAETDEGLLVQPYSYITGDAVESGFCLYYGNYWYSMDLHRRHDIKINDPEIDDPISMMEVYLHIGS